VVVLDGLKTRGLALFLLAIGFATKPNNRVLGDWFRVPLKLPWGLQTVNPTFNNLSSKRVLFKIDLA
jgi:hypothetical protein